MFNVPFKLFYRIVLPMAFWLRSVAVVVGGSVAQDHQRAIHLVRTSMPGLGAWRPSHAGGSALQLLVVAHQISPAQPDAAWIGCPGASWGARQGHLTLPWWITRDTIHFGALKGWAGCRSRHPVVGKVGETPIRQVLGEVGCLVGQIA